MGGSENLNGAAGGSRSLDMALWLSYPSYFLLLSAFWSYLGKQPALSQMPTAMMSCPTIWGHRAKRLMAGASATVSPNKSFILLSCLHDTSCHRDGESTGTLHNCRRLTVALVSISSQQLTLDSQDVLLCPSPPPPSSTVTNTCRQAVTKPAKLIPSDIAKHFCRKSTEYSPWSAQIIKPTPIHSEEKSDWDWVSSENN